MSTNPLMDLAERAVAHAKKCGAQEAVATVGKSRFIDLQIRENKLEKVKESTTSGLGIALYVDGRYSSHSSSDMRWETLDGFIARAVPMTRLLGIDPHRVMTDPKYYANRPTDDLALCDPDYGAVETKRREELARAVEAAARSVKGPIISVTSGYYDTMGEAVRVHSNGFAGEQRTTQSWMGAEVTIEDEGGKKPEEYHWVGARYHRELPDPAKVGRDAAERAVRRKGQVKLPSATMTIVLENRIARRMLGPLLGAMSGSAIQQKRSFLMDMQGKPIGSKKLTLKDDPLRKKGFGSRLFDGDGISARPRTLVDGGVLSEYFIDVYYAHKLGVEPTGGSESNLLLPGGARDAAAIIKDVKQGIYVTGILGGNSDPVGGDFSHGVAGFEIVNGVLGRPVGEMNVTGNHKTLWNQLVEVGNDPYPYSSALLPTLVFENVSVSGV